MDVWQGKKDKVSVYVNTDIYKTIPRARKKNLKAEVIYNGPVHAPILKDDILGKLKVRYKDELLGEYDLYAKENVKKMNIFSRLMKSINYLIWGDA